MELHFKRTECGGKCKIAYVYDIVNDGSSGIHTFYVSSDEVNSSRPNITMKIESGSQIEGIRKNR
jgi:hypothetical protein